jgi:hypothetical protein
MLLSSMLDWIIAAVVVGSYSFRWEYTAKAS